MNALGGGNGIAAGNAFEKVVKKFAEESPSLADAVKNGPAIEALAETLSAMKGIAGFDAEELAKKMRAAKGNEQKFATLMHEIETKLPSLGRDNVMDWEGNLTQTQAAWAAMGGGQNNDAGGQTTTPPNPYVTPRSFVSTGTKLNAIQIDWSKPKDEIMPLIISQLPTDLSADEKKPNSEYMKGLRKWIDDLTGVPTAKKQEIIDELKKDGKHYVE